MQTVIIIESPQHGMLMITAACNAPDDKRSDIRRLLRQVFMITGMS